LRTDARSGARTRRAPSYCRGPSRFHRAERFEILCEDGMIVRSCRAAETGQTVLHGCIPNVLVLDSRGEPFTTSPEKWTPGTLGTSSRDLSVNDQRKLLREFKW
jgi:hypothetical protein